MQKMIMLVPFLIVWFSTGCDPESKLAQCPLNAEINLNFDSSCIFDDSKLEIEFSRVEDSRCPTTVECIWAGEAKVSLDAKANGKSETLLLTYPGAGAPTIVDTFENYRIQLSEVNPYPVTPNSNKPEDYVLKLKVEKL